MCCANEHDPTWYRGSQTAICARVECRVFSDRDDVRRNDQCRAIIRGASRARQSRGLRRRERGSPGTGGKKGGLIKTIKFLRRTDEETSWHGNCD